MSRENQYSISLQKQDIDLHVAYRTKTCTVYVEKETIQCQYFLYGWNSISCSCTGGTLFSAMIQLPIIVLSIHQPIEAGCEGYGGQSYTVQLHVMDDGYFEPRREGNLQEQ